MTSGHVPTTSILPCRVGLVVSVSASHTGGRHVCSRPGRVIPKNIIKMVQTASLHDTQRVRVGV